ncbi:MAG: kinase [Rhodospirillales bacterium]|nr:kinase [Rhodospirillales bacterium]
MIISRAPFRVSFFGGGTDYPTWFQENGGQVLSTTIDKYCYITARFLPQFFDYKSRIVWSKVENVINTDEIQHPVVREVLNYLKINQGIEIHHIGDLPARTGLGSSSSFTVALLQALYGLQEEMRSKKSLANEAIFVEQQLLSEAVGVQDQVAVAHGGFNHIEIRKNGTFNVNPMIVPRKRLNELEDSLMLFYSGVSRFASDIATKKIEAIPNKKVELNTLSTFVDAAIRILREGDIHDFGRLLHESWLVKRSISSAISTDVIDDIYNKAVTAGALGGKILGAGGGGFVLIYAQREKQPSVRKALESYLEIPVKFETGGAQVTFYENTWWNKDTQEQD